MVNQFIWFIVKFLSNHKLLRGSEGSPIKRPCQEKTLPHRKKPSFFSQGQPSRQYGVFFLKSLRPHFQMFSGSGSIQGLGSDHANGLI